MSAIFFLGDRGISNWAEPSGEWGEAGEQLHPPMHETSEDADDDDDDHGESEEAVDAAEDFGCDRMYRPSWGV